ncbi:MAG: tRNA lysidine(34) synthetase TilS [Clostridia bacterium]|nr:tRNA lysidine(34) synthetase TilS [Clostridia bacterium]
MLTVSKIIKNNNLFKSGEVVGVAVSGGIDSMSLLHFLNENKTKLNIELVAIMVDHKMRENSASEVEFVKDYCKKNKIKFNKFQVDALALAEEHKLTKEEAARKARYGVFDALIAKGIVDKICLGHHVSDQAETVLLNLFRGAGLSGAKGMELVRDNYIRPMLYTTKLEIQNYAKANDIPFIVDESNLDNEFSRNYLRNVIMPQLKERFKGVENNLVSFSKIAKTDDDYINNIMNIDAIIKDDYIVRIPVSYFVYPESIINRMLRHCFEYLGVSKDVEKKHIEIIKEMVKDAVNGIKLNLPNKVNVHKEYDYITIIANEKKYKFEEQELKSGTINIKNFGKITVKRTYDIDVAQKDHIVDVKKVPSNAVWRPRREGDMFTKFGGGTKKLKDYLIDKKIPNRLRDAMPVLAVGSQVLIVAGQDISEQVKVDVNTKAAYILTYNIKL